MSNGAKGAATPEGWDQYQSEAPQDQWVRCSLLSGLRLCIDPIWPRGLHSSSLNSDQHTRNSSTAPPSLLQSPRRSTPNGAAATRSLQTGPSRRQATAARYPVALQSMAAPIAGPPRAWKSADRHCAIGGKEGKPSGASGRGLGKVVVAKIGINPGPSCPSHCRGKARGLHKAVHLGQGCGGLRVVGLLEVGLMDRKVVKRKFLPLPPNV